MTGHSPAPSALSVHSVSQVLSGTVPNREGSEHERLDVKDRYQMIYAPCDATSERWWGHVVASAHSILALWEKAEWRGRSSYDQLMIVRDNRTGREMSIDEYADIIKRLKGWN